MANYDDALKATFPNGFVPAEMPPEPELVKGVRERLDALTGMGGGPWANAWSSIDYAGSLRSRLEVDLAHHTPATPAERLALLERIDALSVAMGRAWQVADMLGWESPSAVQVPVIAAAYGRIGDPEPMRAALASVGYREAGNGE